jgi:nucleosome assembly protein 1-like 1
MAESVSEEKPSYEEKLRAQKEIAKGMKISELKLKLQAKGILTTTFCEKSEFVEAYAKSVVNGNENALVDTVSDSDDDDDEGEKQKDMFPTSVLHRVEKLKALNDEREEQRKLYLEERAKLEVKYHELAKPLYEQRRAIIVGEKDEEIANEHEGEGGATEEKVVGIPQFWVCAIGHMGPVAELINEQDVDCLEHLQDIQCVDEENGEGFTLSFHFSRNEFFENSVLTKRYEVPNLLLADEPILKDVQGCEIMWKEGKCLTSSEVTKQQRGKGKNAGQVRSVKKQDRVDSFFHFFTAPQITSMENMNEQEAERLEHDFDQDYDIAQAFRSHIIPKAVLWFTGEVTMF